MNNEYDDMTLLQLNTLRLKLKDQAFMKGPTMNLLRQIDDIDNKIYFLNIKIKQLGLKSYGNSKNNQ